MQNVSCEEHEYCRKCDPDVYATMTGATYFCPVCEAADIASTYENDFEFNDYLFDGDYMRYKYCDGCERNVCIRCVAITGCQTTEGKCKNCFDYKCDRCEAEISREKQYLWDDEPYALCDRCKLVNKSR